MVSSGIIIHIAIWVPIITLFLWDRGSALKSRYSSKYTVDWEPFGWGDTYYGETHGYARFPYANLPDSVDNPQQTDYGIHSPKQKGGSVPQASDGESEG